MKDPIVEETRRYRMEHTKEFRSDLRLICEDLRKFEQTLSGPKVKPQPRSLKDHKQNIQLE